MRDTFTKRGMKLISTLLKIAVLIAPVVADTVCRIVSMSGGGSHGAFEIGVVTRLMENPGWEPWDVNLGVSAGSLGILSLLKDDYSQNMEKVKNIWADITTKDVIQPLGSPNSFSGNRKVMKMITETYDTLTGAEANGRFEVGVTDLISGEFMSLRLNPRSPNMTYILASTSIPMIFPPSSILIKSKVIEAVDGGLQKNEYYLSSLQYCPPGTNSYVMDMIFANFEPDNYKPSSWNLWTISTRSIELAINDFNDLYFKDVSECSGMKGLNLEIRIHSPPSPITVNSLDFNQGHWLWSIGYNNMTTMIKHC